jgi:hypothetical protein
MRRPKHRKLSCRHSSHEIQARAQQYSWPRGALVVVQHSILTNAAEACLLGVHPSVTEIIGELSMTDIERIVERRFRYIQPRWEDRPAIWQRLIQAACSPDIRLARDFTLRGLQLLAGELL